MKKNRLIIKSIKEKNLKKNYKINKILNVKVTWDIFNMLGGEWKKFDVNYQDFLIVSLVKIIV